MESIDSLIQSWDGETVVTQYDRPTGAWILIAIHSGVLGTPSGGTRMMTYPRLEDALRDAMRLAAGMTHKWAVVDFPRGGGKAVIAVPPTLSTVARQGLLVRYANLLERLHGAFESGPDLGTNPADMDVIGQHTSHIFGKTPAAGGAGDAGRFTAQGVFAGMQAAAEYVWGVRDLRYRCVLIQGAGSVGGNLIRLLAEAGARIKVAEVDAQRLEAVRGVGDLEIVEPGSEYGEACDIFSPCATGAVLNPETIPQLRCRIVAGAANNQLAAAADAELLRQRNIHYAPDFVINAGAAIALPALESMGWSKEDVNQRLRGIGDTILEVFRQSEETGMVTAEVAMLMARRRLDAAGQEPGGKASDN